MTAIFVELQSHWKYAIENGLQIESLNELHFEFKNGVETQSQNESLTFFNFPVTESLSMSSSTLPIIAPFSGLIIQRMDYSVFYGV